MSRTLARVLRPALLGLALLGALPALARPPRLVLFVAVDALSSDTLLRHRPLLKGGLARLMDAGAFYPAARYQYSETRTAPGHSTLATGANPWRHGIVDNLIVEREGFKLVRPFSHDAHPLLEAPTAPGDDACPEALLAETLSDRLRVATAERGKVVALSAKGRAAIPLAGRLGQGYWFNDQAGKFVTSTWYTKALPAWLTAFNARGLPQSYHGQTWELALPRDRYPGADDAPWEANVFGLGRTFPHPLDGGLPSPGPTSNVAFVNSPFVNDVLVQLGKAALAGEALGRDEVPDILALSFTGTDSMLHVFGPQSWEMTDTVVRLDRALGELIAAAEKAAGRGNLLVVLAADHGGSPAPESLAAQGLPGVRVNPRQLEGELVKELQARFPGGDFRVRFEELDLYLGGGALAPGGKVDPVAARRVAAEWLRRQPWVQVALSRDELWSGPDTQGLVAPMRRTFHPARSGDVLYVPRALTIVEEETGGSNHGSPWAYDQTVPVVFWGKGIKPGLYAEAISPTDVAPTVSVLLGMGAPASSEGVPRHEALRAEPTRARAR